MYEILKHLEAIKISGLNCQKFLQNLTTNNVKDKLFSYNYLLDNKGRYLFDCFIYKVQNETTDIESYIILSNQKHLEDLITHFNFFKLREQIKVEDLSTKYKILYSQKIISNKDIIFSIKDPRHFKLGYLSMIFQDSLELLEIKFTENLYLKDKYEISIIDGAFDLVNKKSIILEYGALELNAIDINKGCYLGQELISRVINQGVVRKKIYKITSKTLINKDLAHTPLLLKDRKIGHICSVYKNFAIALISIDKLPYENIQSFMFSDDHLLNATLQQAEWYND